MLAIAPPSRSLHRPARCRARSDCRHRLPDPTGQAGQAGIFLLLVAVALTAAVLVGLVGLGASGVDRTRAQTAADAAALASVGSGRAAAVSLAAEHGAVVVSWRRGPGHREVTVTVRIDDVVATARARLGDD